MGFPIALGLGSNLGARMRHLELARRRLDEIVEDARYSSVYLTEPEGVPDQPRFLNACCIGVTRHSPGDLLRDLKRIEQEAGRRPGGVRYGPRELDLDILLYGAKIVAEPALRIPHPRLRERAFVLVPLAEIAEEWVEPVSGLTIAELADRVDRSGVSFADRMPTRDATPGVVGRTGRQSGERRRSLANREGREG